MFMSRRLSFSSSSSPWFEKISLFHPCYLLPSSYQSLRYPKHATIGYLEVSIQNIKKNRSNDNVSYAQTCCRTKIKLTLAVTNRKCRRNWFKKLLKMTNKITHQALQRKTKFAETAGQMTVLWAISDRTNFRVGQGFWVYGIQGLFKSGIRYIAA